MSPPQQHAAAPDVESVRQVLSGVIDPELGVDIVTLGMVPSIDVESDGVVTIEVKLTIKGCPLRTEIRDTITERVSRHPGVSRVDIVWGEMTPSERATVMDTARWNARSSAPLTTIPTGCRVIAVGSGKGGVGKSSITVNTAVALAKRGYTVGLLDADIWGFSVPRLLGMDGGLEARRVPGSEKPRIIPAAMTVGAGELKVVSTGFLVEESTALMWRGLMLSKAVEQFLTDVEWGDLDFLLIDLPPGTGDVQMGLARILPQTAMVIVTTPAQAAQRVAQRAADMAHRSFLSTIGVVENMSAFVCDHGTSYALYGSGGGAELAAAIDAPLLAQIPLDPALAAGNDAGEPVALGDAASSAALFAELARTLDELTDIPSAAEGCTARILEAAEAAFQQADGVAG